MFYESVYMCQAAILCACAHVFSLIVVFSGTFSILTLRELEAAACLWLSWLLTLNLTCVTCDEACLAECLLIVSIYLNECASDSEAESLALSCETATVEVSLNVVLLCNLEELEWLLNHILEDS